VFISIFFFSSRRRHTRFSRDWSSDVCSSDLCAMNYHGNPCWYELGTGDLDAASGFYRRILGWEVVDSGMEGFDYRLAKSGSDMRSEERRVGKEGRLWWSADHEKTDSII